MQKIENKVRVLARSLPSDGKLQKKTSNVADRIVTEYQKYQLVTDKKKYDLSDEQEITFRELIKNDINL